MTAIFGDPVDEALWRSENPLAMARQLTPEDLDGLLVHFDCGNRDRYGFEVPNAELHEVLVERKIEHTWALVDGGGHGWNTRDTSQGYNQTVLPRSLTIIGEAFAAAARKAPANDR